MRAQRRTRAHTHTHLDPHVFVHCNDVLYLEAVAWPCADPHLWPAATAVASIYGPCLCIARLPLHPRSVQPMRRGSLRRCTVHDIGVGTALLRSTHPTSSPPASRGRARSSGSRRSQRSSHTCTLAMARARARRMRTGSGTHAQTCTFQRKRPPHSPAHTMHVSVHTMSVHTITSAHAQWLYFSRTRAVAVHFDLDDLGYGSSGGRTLSRNGQKSEQA
jgi:hypothetical protein